MVEHVDDARRRLLRLTALSVAAARCLPALPSRCLAENGRPDGNRSMKGRVLNAGRCGNRPRGGQPRPP